MTRSFRARDSALHVALDGRYIRTTHHDGISRFSAHLFAALAQLVESRDDIRLTLLVSNGEQRSRVPYSGDLPTFIVSAPTSPREPFIARRVNKLQPDIVFSPMQTMGSSGRKYRLILTVHDLIYYRYPTPPREFGIGLRAMWRLYHLSWWPQRLLLRGADAVVAVSETTKRLIERHRLTSRPIFVVPNAAEASENSGPLPFSQRTRRLVYMGSFMPYKNVATLIRAAQLLPDWELHVMSKIGPSERARLNALAPQARVIFHDGVSDEEYVAALRTATALVTASRDEGFGIPLVEAMAQGTPIVVSDIAIFREIGGQAALYASPDSPADFAAQIRTLADESEWAHRSAACARQATRYQWSSSAADLLDVLCHVSGTQA